MTIEEVPSNANNKNINQFIYNIFIVSISFLSVICDVLLGLAVIMQYSSLGNTSWAIITFMFIFFPSVVLQIYSIKLCLSNRKMLPIQWLFHSILLGIIYRYISIFRKCVTSYKAKSCIDSNLVKTEIIILKKLFLFKSFLESAPQLVLQLYFVTVTPFSIPLTAFLATASAFSIVWALLIHTKFKKDNNCFGLVFLILWRVGMITARISALVLCAYTCGPWMILFIGSHWLAVTLWITYQKAATDDKDKKGEFHSALFGVVYCFCFFSIKIGQSRSKALILNSLLLFQNLIFLTVFLMSFSTDSPRLSILSFTTVVFGSLLGISSFFIYNTFFHPRGYLKCMTSTKESFCCKTINGLFNKQSNFLIFRKDIEKRKTVNRLENKKIQNVQSPSDSIIIIEEIPTPDLKVDEKILRSPSDKTENIYDEPKSNETETETEEVKLSTALKRRAICSSVDLTRFLDEKTENASLESNTGSKAVAGEETSSEILSTHDYENLCAVNIAREPWGIRSWRVYSDIETWRHDDSVFNERRLDNMTTSSEYSAKIEDKDSLNIVEDELSNFEIDTNSDKTSVNFVPPFPTSMLHTIFEERESPSDFENNKVTGNSESTLVATIDKICMYTPLRIRSVSSDYYAESSEICQESRNKIENVKFDEENRLKRECPLENEKKDGISPLKEKIRSVQKFNIFKERYEINRYQVCGKMADSKAEGSEASKNNETNKENVSDNSFNNGTKKSFSFKDGSSFLMQMLTPSKLEKRTFPISPPKR